MRYLLALLTIVMVGCDTTEVVPEEVAPLVDTSDVFRFSDMNGVYPDTYWDTHGPFFGDVPTWEYRRVLVVEATDDGQISVLDSADVRGTPVPQWDPGPNATYRGYAVHNQANGFVYFILKEEGVVVQNPGDRFPTSCEIPVFPFQDSGVLIWDCDNNINNRYYRLEERE